MVPFSSAHTIFHRVPRHCVILCLIGLLCIIGFSGCRKAPGTARDQLIYISEEKEIALGLSAFREVLKNSRLSTDPKLTVMVNKIGHRIAEAANKPEYHWEFAVIQDDRQVNAFALPGGKVAVYTGILKLTKNEAGLATVMAHEVAHALQRHGAERYSRGILEQIGQLGSGLRQCGCSRRYRSASVAVGAMSAYGVGVSLPNSRAQESEADFIGLQLMAKAGYDPSRSRGIFGNV